MASCRRLLIGVSLIFENLNRPITNRPQVTNLPHKLYANSLAASLEK